MKKHLLPRSIVLLLCFRLITYGSTSSSLKTQYNSPATVWEREALPIGNGFIGAMLFGDVYTDVIQINVHSLWSGGPGKNPSYDGGHLQTPALVHQSLQNIRNTLQDKMTNFSANHTAYIDQSGKVISSNYETENVALRSDIKVLMGSKEDFGSYQSLCNLNIAYSEMVSPELVHMPTRLSGIALENANTSDFVAYTHYRRELDIDSAVAQVTYTQNDVNYRREYFMSHPDNSLIIRFTSDTPGMISRVIWLTTPQIKSNIIASADGSITLTGQPADHGVNGLNFAQYLKVNAKNGTVAVSGTKLIVTGADELLIVLSAATNYQQCMDDSFNYFTMIDPLEKATDAVNKTIQENYENIIKNHISDYQSLFNRLSLNLEGAANINNKTTDQLLSGYKNLTNTTAEDLYLEQLYYQFGRYLLISSSRPNGLPANLQGIWAEGLTPPWASDYHTNINLQMNYWLAGPANLSDCHLPVINYINSLVPRGRISANHYYCKPDGGKVRGWVIHHENNIWGNTAPGNWYEGFHFPAAAAWMCQDIWEYYQFNQDQSILEANFPVMLEAALFWVDNLWRDTRDGTLVANPSYSPEHGPYSLGTSSDQAIITELFDMTIKAYHILHHQQADSPEIAEIVRAKSYLAGPQIGLNEQFMEWKDETTMDITGDKGHRHVAHLFWLHPGSQIIPGRSAQENLYAEAMKKTLNTRGDGGTGWSKAWKINFWARLRDGNHAHKLLEELLKESTLDNLFDTHPPFQIDGNFGATAGMTEMLVQSHGEYIEMLPALPDKWSAGTFTGIKARGNFSLNAQWENKELKQLEIASLSGNDCNLKYSGISSFNIRIKDGGDISPVVYCGNSISFPTEIGKTYIISP
ncbi:MAG: glycoside hydrolase family 95 protein [Paludibacter sp.]|nr:glycoside hydrolase family 95 protein [Paludibacter sp.]